LKGFYFFVIVSVFLEGEEKLWLQQKQLLPNGNPRQRRLTSSSSDIVLKSWKK